MYPDEQRLKADSSASLRNDKQIGVQQFRHCSNAATFNRQTLNFNRQTLNKER